MRVDGTLALLGHGLRARLLAGMARSSTYSPDASRWLLRWAWVCLGCAALLYLVCGYHAGFLRLNGAAAAYPDWIWQCLTVLGDERVAFALTLFFSLRYPRLFWSLVIAALIAILYGRGLKELFDATRPPGVLAADAFNLIGPERVRASFPSGHSVTAAVFFGVLIAHARLWEWRALWLVLAVLVGLSRVAVGVHWPLDVLVGLMGGAVAAWLGSWLAARWSAPASHLTLHLVWVGVAVLLAITLIDDDGGYPAAALPLRILGLTALASALLQYLLLPLWTRAGESNGPRPGQ